MKSKYNVLSKKIASITFVFALLICLFSMISLQVGAMSTPKQIVFIDSDVPDSAGIINSVPKDAKIFYISGTSDGINQICTALSDNRDLNAIHIISHGAPGTIVLGNSVLSLNTLAQYESQLKKIGNSLAEGGDILIYGCNVTKGTDGMALIDSISKLCNADVAASMDATGANDLGGNWTLETVTGVINAQTLAPTGYSGILATTIDFETSGWNTTSQSYAGFTWGNFTLYEGGTGVGGGDELIFTSSNLAASITCESGLFTPVSVAAYNWITGDQTVTFIGYRNGVEVASADYTLPVNAVSNPNTLVNFAELSADFVNLSQLVIDPTTNGNNTGAIDNFTYATVDTTSTITDGTGVTEPVPIATTADTIGEAVNVFDFKVTDTGSDGMTTDISQVILNTSGTGDFSKLTWRLNGSDASNVTGSYNAVSHTLTFSGLSISVANSGNETYTVNAYYNNTSGLTEDQTYVFSLAPSSGVTVSSGGSQLASGQAVVTNGTGSTVDVTATALAIVTQPDGSTSGSPLTTQMVVKAVDVFGNTDIDFTGNVTVSENDAGSLSGTLTVGAVAGVATFTDVAYTATADGEVFQLEASASGLTGVTSNDITSALPNANPVIDSLPDIDLTDTASADTFANQTGTISATDADGIAAYGIVGGTTGGSDDIGGTIYDISLAGSYGVLYVKSSNGQYVYVPDNTAINALTGNQSESFAVTATDSNVHPATGTSTLTVNITGTNDTPIITSATTDNIAENATGTSYTATATEPDSGQTLTWTLGGTDAALFSINGSGQISFNSAPNYESPTDNGTDNVYNITVTATDDGAGTLFATQAVAITVTDVNEAPVNTVPAAQITNEDTTLVFSAGNGNALSVADQDSGSTLTTVLSVASGTGTLNVTTGGGATITGDGSNSVQIVGTAAQVNAALTSISYVPPANASGTGYATLTISTTDDGAGTLNDTDTVTIDITPVNDAPTVSVPASIIVTEDLAGVIAGISVSDADSGSASVTVTLSATSGTLTAVSGGGVTCSGSGTAALSLSGSIANINTFIAGSNVTFTTAANATSNVTLTTSINDGGNTGSGGAKTSSDTTTLSVIPVNDPPAVTNLNGDSVSFSIGGSPVIFDSGANVTLTDVDSVDFNGGNVTVSIVTNGQAGEDILSVQNQGNGAGQIGASGGIVSYGGTAIGTYAGGSAGADLVISLNANATSAAVQALLGVLSYYDNDASTVNTATRTVRITVSDGDGGTSGNSDVTVILVRAPILDLDTSASGSGYSGSFTEDGGAVVATATTSASDDGTFKSLAVTLTNHPDGASESLSSTYGSGAQIVNGEAVTIGTYNSGTGVLTITVDDGSTSSATMQMLMESIRYNNSSQNPDTTNRSIVFTAVDNDDNTGGNVTATISITAVNDVPTTGTNTGKTVSEGNANDIIAQVNLEVTDTDTAAASITYTLTEVPAHGTLKKSGVPLAQNGTFTQDDINNNIITYTHDGSETTSDSFKFTASDGAGGSIAETTFSITVTPVNDAPTVTATGANPTFIEGGSAQALFSGASVDTVEAGQTITELKLTVSNLSNGSSEILVIDNTDVALTNGMSGTTTANSISYSVSVSGSIATITITKAGNITASTMQILIDGLKYSNTSSPLTVGNRVITLTSIRDNGGTAGGGMDTATLSIAATVTVVAKTAPGAPTGITATAGNGQATVSFIAPASDGGSAITSYTVTANPGGITATGTASPITVTGLTNGTAYTFTVTATNSVGTGPDSAPSGSVTPKAVYILPGDGGTGGSDSGDGGSSDTNVEVNGQSYSAGTSETGTNAQGQTVTTVTVDTQQLQDILENQGTGAIVTIPVAMGSEVAAGVLTGEMVDTMEQNGATLVIDTGSATYTLPAEEIDINAVSAQFGENVSLSDITVTVTVSEPSDDMVKVVQNTSGEGGYTLVVPAVEFTVSCTYGDQTVDVTSFGAYVDRTITIPDGVDPNEITTAVVVSSDGTTRSVPTEIVYDSATGHYVAVIHSLTNSVYTVVYNPVEFPDVANHWAKDAINDMGSRMIVTGDENGNFNPDNSITRAEFAAIIVRALGLPLDNGVSSFSDVGTSSWYCGYIETAAAYGIINGYGDGTFGPNDLITREQAMTMIARAMAITGLETVLSDSGINRLLASYTDSENISDYAKTGVEACIETGVVTGKTSSTIAPKDTITRAEVAVMVQRLLQQSELI